MLKRRQSEKHNVKWCNFVSQLYHTIHITMTVTKWKFKQKIHAIYRIPRILNIIHYIFKLIKLLNNKNFCNY